MSVEIKNLTNRPVLMRLNSGRSLHLAPGATSTELADTEISNNAKVEKLTGRHVIALNAVSKRAHRAPSAKKAKAKKAKK